ncbi:allantoinase AllB [Chitinophaga tropicalis]|uniref:allantoinase n=1 Tax=Chitinophaga tropicalis TaxID=2683588 RepID=A0A7K1U8I1_9BACT|nr:allantoinase AllB [Chitinophaga tropicalis]MVT10684.1 allantoinase AllB [Chitinophaga tropicalis]
MFDLILKGNKVLTPNGIKKAFVLINNGRIEDVVHVLPGTVTTPVTDIGDLVLMPGITDPHVHINEPGRTDWEGFETATLSAITGGITTLVDMPLNSHPVTTTVKAFHEKLHAAAGQLHSNCGFWGGIVPGNAHEVNGLIDEGVLGFKAFLTHSGIDDFPNVTAADLEKVMPLIAAHGLPLLVHCEITPPGYRPSVTDHRSYAEYLGSRPREWEHAAIALMIRLCKKYNCRVHIVHLSSADALEQIAAAKERGLPLTVETAQHYLYFNAEDIPDGQTAFKCAPPIRERANNQRLWEALRSGLIDFVATDHSPAPPAMKQQESGNFSTAWGGIASLQLALPVLWSAARKQGCTPEQIALWMCERPAMLAGIYRTKGRIAPGYDADLVVWDPEASFTVTADILHHKHKVTPYLHETLYGVAEQTYLEGVKVSERGIPLYPHRGNIIKSS